MNNNRNIEKRIGTEKEKMSYQIKIKKLILLWYIKKMVPNL